MKINHFILPVLISALLLSACDQKKKQTDAIHEQAVQVDSILKNTPVLTPAQVKKTNELINNYVAFADKYRDDTLSAAYLFDAANKKTFIPDYEGAVALFDTVARRYPNSDLAPKALMSAGTLCEKMIGDIDRAKGYYMQIKEKYPNSPLANGIDMIIEYAGKSDEELFNAIMMKKAERDSIHHADSSSAVK